jgi:hypothetical protein
MYENFVNIIGHSLQHENIYLDSNTSFFAFRIIYITIIYDK